MINKERIKAEADAFFEWPSEDKTHVTTTSMLIFANVIAEMVRTEERGACGEIVNKKADEVLANNTHRGRTNSAASFAASVLEDVGAAIRMRSNA